MRVTFDDGNFQTDITELLNRMTKLPEKEQKSFLKKCGEIIKKCVRRSMERNKMRSKINRADYVHMMDDIKVQIKKSKIGNLFVRVGGGKATGYKWRFLNDGAIDQRGNILNDANHFMEQAINEASKEIEEEVTKLCERMVNIE